MAGGQKTGGSRFGKRTQRDGQRMESGRHVYPCILGQGRRQFERTYGEKTLTGINRNKKIGIKIKENQAASTLKRRGEKVEKKT